MKKFKDISEQYREEGRHKLIYPKNKAVASPRPESDSAKVKLGEEMQTPSIGVRSLYTKMYAKHGGTASKVKDAQSKAYAEVEKKHGKEMRNSLEAFHKKNMNEAVKDKFDIGEYDQEGDMAKSDLRSILANAKRVHDMLEDSDNLPEWVQSKITKAEDYMSTVANYMEAEMNEEVELDEMDKSQPSSSRGAEGVPTGKKAYPVKTDKVKSDALKVLQKQYKKVKEEVEQIDEISAETKASYVTKAKKDIEDLKPHTKGEYGDIAKNIIKRREKGIAMAKEEVELDEENKPTNPELWSRAVAMAKSKFDVYPSAYANGWAAKWYKSKGGGWRSVNEAKDDLPFTPDKPQKQSVIPGKYGAGYSMARQLARQAMQKQIEKMKKKPVKEETNKAKIVKDVLKKKSSEDAFQKDPELSSTLTKGF
jgi:hypothetical protein